MAYNPAMPLYVVTNPVTGKTFEVQADRFIIGVDGSLAFATTERGASGRNIAFVAGTPGLTVIEKEPAG